MAAPARHHDLGGAKAKLGLAALLLLAGFAPAPAAAADYRYSLQLGDPAKVIRTDRETGATTVCRNTAHGVWCPPNPETCRTVLDKVQAWQAEHDLPSQQQVIDCLQHNRCDTRPPPSPPSAEAAGGVDPATLSWCQEHDGRSAP